VVLIGTDAGLQMNRWTCGATWATGDQELYSGNSHPSRCIRVLKPKRQSATTAVALASPRGTGHRLSDCNDVQPLDDVRLVRCIMRKLNNLFAATGYANFEKTTSNATPKMTCGRTVCSC
jgi:hypothetical protein